MGRRNTCCLCGTSIDPLIDLKDEDGNHYHRACNLTAASTLYKFALDRIAELEAENEGLLSRRLPYREAEIAQKRYEDAEAELAERERSRGLSPATEVGAWISVDGGEPFWVPVVPKERIEVHTYDANSSEFVRAHAEEGSRT